jgi:hypothetical protein
MLNSFQPLGCPALIQRHSPPSTFGAIFLSGPAKTVEQAIGQVGATHVIQGLTTSYQAPSYRAAEPIRHATLFLQDPTLDQSVIAWIKASSLSAEESGGGRGRGGGGLDCRPAYRNRLLFAKPEAGKAALSILTLQNGDQSLKQLWALLCGPLFMKSLDIITTRWVGSTPHARQTVVTLHTHPKQEAQLERLGRALWRRSPVLTLPSFYTPKHFQ